MNQIKCDPHGVKMAENLRTFAAMVEAGEITAVGICYTYALGSDPAMGSGFWRDDDNGSLFALVAAVHVLAARVDKAFGIDD